MDMTIQEEIEQLVLRCIAADGLKACPKDISFLEKYRLKNLYFLSVRYRMEGTDCPELDRRAEGLIRWNIYSTDFPLLRRVYARNVRKYPSSRYRHLINASFPSLAYTRRRSGKSVE